MVAGGWAESIVIIILPKKEVSQATFLNLMWQEDECKNELL